MVCITHFIEVFSVQTDSMCLTKIIQGTARVCITHFIEVLSVQTDQMCSAKIRQGTAMVCIAHFIEVFSVLGSQVQCPSPRSDKELPWYVLDTSYLHLQYMLIRAYSKY